MIAAFYTLGCKLNQCETEAIISSFRNHGIKPVPPTAKADIFIINTCTVTSKSDQKARRIIRLVAKKNPRALIIVTGCYAQVNALQLSQLVEHTLIISQQEKDLLLDLPAYLYKQKSFSRLDRLEKYNLVNQFVKLNKHKAGDLFRLQTVQQEYHTRAFLKIQDGCDYFCAYCIVPRTRGRTQSLNPYDIIERIKGFTRNDYHEIVLTGVNIMLYEYNGLNLVQLLRLILDKTTGVRIRLSSLEPDRIDDDLIEVIKHKRICAHFHIPVQAGADNVLKAMKRRYKAAKVYNVVRKIKDLKPNCFLAADIIVGFPGETTEDFNRTQKLITDLGFSRLHVFPFSPRPGTQAFGLKNNIPQSEIKNRVRKLLDLSAKLYQQYTYLWEKKELEVVLQGRDKKGMWQGLTDNYLRVKLKGLKQDATLSRKLVTVRIEKCGDICEASLVNKPEV